MAKKIFITVMALLFGALVFSGCLQQAEETSLQFSAAPCDENVDVFDHSQFGVQEAVWLDDSTLQVKAFVSMNCAETIEGGDFEISGDTINLHYRVPECENCTLCNCAQEITFLFSNLERKDYAFRLEKVE